MSERHQYKVDFESEYSEYLRLHSTISQRMQTFSALRDRLHNAAPNSPEYEVFVAAIIFAYSLFSHRFYWFLGGF